MYTTFDVSHWLITHETWKNVTLSIKIALNISLKKKTKNNNNSIQKPNETTYSVKWDK